MAGKSWVQLVEGAAVAMALNATSIAMKCHVLSTGEDLELLLYSCPRRGVERSSARAWGRHLSWFSFMPHLNCCISMLSTPIIDRQPSAQNQSIFCANGFRHDASRVGANVTIALRSAREDSCSRFFGIIIDVGMRVASEHRRRIARRLPAGPAGRADRRICAQPSPPAITVSG